MNWIPIIILAVIMCLAVWAMLNLANSADKAREEYEPLKKRALAIKTADEYDAVVEDAIKWQKQLFHHTQHAMAHELKGILQVKLSQLKE